MSIVASSVIAAGYLVAGFLTGSVERMLQTVGFCVVPLACIWFPEAFGDYSGEFSFGFISKASPARFVWFLGWVVLLLPMIVALIYWL